MPTDPWFYLATVVAVVLLGLAKGGLAGAGLLAMPLMSLAMPPLQAGAILLPVLLVQDVVTVAAFRRSWDGASLKRLIPGGIAGVGLGYLLAASTPANAVEAAVGGIALCFALVRLARPKVAEEGRRDHGGVALLTGLASGFTSQVAHAGAPPFQIYMLRRRLPSATYLGTAAIFFATLDVVKLPAFLALGQLRTADLMVSAVMAPVAVLSSWGGVWLMRRLPVERLYRLVTIMLLAVGGVLLAKGVLG